MDFNESLIDFIVESENKQEKSNGKIKDNIEEKIKDMVKTNGNELAMLNPIAMLMMKSNLQHEYQTQTTQM